MNKRPSSGLPSLMKKRPSAGLPSGGKRRKVDKKIILDKLPVSILCGFLGAGKTTLLNHILTAQHGRKYAVIENEFGEVSVDNQLIDAAVGKLDTVESITVLDNGCLCCTVRDDLVGAIKDIVAVVEEKFKTDGMKAMLDGILIETTGMADPGPIIKTFGMDEQVQKFCKIDGILTVVDCKHFLDQLNRERPGDAVNESAQQVGFADKLLLNKVDVCDRAKIEETKAAIRGINGLVPIRECSIGKNPEDIQISELLKIEAFDGAKLLTMVGSGNEEINLIASMEEPVTLPIADGHGDGYGGDGHGGGHGDESMGHGDEGGHGGGSGHGGDSGGAGHGTRAPKGVSRHDTDVKSMVLERRGDALNMHAFQEFLGKILEEKSVDLYRYKGVLAVEGGGKTLLYILQGVHDMPEITFSGEWPENKPKKTQLVMIGRKLDEDTYRENFNKCFDK